MIELEKSIYGNINVSEDLIRKLVGKAAIECYGVVGMFSKNIKEDIKKIFNKEKYEKGVEINNKADICEINVHVFLAYGGKIDIIAKNIMDQISYVLNQYIPGLNKVINIYIDGIYC